MNAIAAAISIGVLLAVFTAAEAAGVEAGVARRTDAVLAAAEGSARRSSHALGTPRDEAPARTARIVRATDLIGSKVKNAEGEELGEVVDLAIDGRLGRANYVVLASGGWLGIGERLYAVPILALQHPAQGDYLLVDIPLARLQASVGFEADQWPLRADDRLLRRPEDDATGGPGATGARRSNRPGGQSR